jgi:hypothetical protein
MVTNIRGVMKLVEDIMADDRGYDQEVLTIQLYVLLGKYSFV